MDKNMSRDRLNTTIDLMIAVVVEELSRAMNADRDKTLVDFITSDTGRLLYDESSKLWWRGPSDIASMYEIECGHRHEAQPIRVT